MAGRYNRSSGVFRHSLCVNGRTGPYGTGSAPASAAGTGPEDGAAQEAANYATAVDAAGLRWEQVPVLVARY